MELLNSDFVVSALINRAGLVYIGKILYRFTDKEQETILDGDLTKIGTTNQMVYKSNSLMTPVTKQSRMAIGDFCAQSWRSKLSADQERKISLDIKMRITSYATGTYVLGPYSGSLNRYECQPTAFGVPDKKNHHWDGSWDWGNYRTTNHLKSTWSFSVIRADNGQIQSAYDNYEYYNDWNFIDYGGTILTFYDVPGMYAVNGSYYQNQMIPKFQFDGGFYYTDGVPFAQRMFMECP